MNKPYLKLKRVLDFTLSLIAIILFSPILIVIAIMIKFNSKGPVFFKQKRVGINNTHFYIYKFRTMRIDAPKDAPTDQLDNPEMWITRTGKFLRKSSLDELPQLINILKGEMSIVGPRPALWNQFNLLEIRKTQHIDQLKPGLTGLAQINGRDENNDVEKVFWDKKYLNSICFSTDCKCIYDTAISIIKGDGILEGGVKED